MSITSRIHQLRAAVETRLSGQPRAIRTGHDIDAMRRVGAERIGNVYNLDSYRLRHNVAALIGNTSPKRPAGA